MEAEQGVELVETPGMALQLDGGNGERNDGVAFLDWSAVLGPYEVDCFSRGGRVVALALPYLLGPFIGFGEALLLCCFSSVACWSLLESIGV